jgi:hypothetical protein
LYLFVKAAAGIDAPPASHGRPAHAPPARGATDGVNCLPFAPIYRHAVATGTERVMRFSLQLSIFSTFAA